MQINQVVRCDDACLAEVTELGEEWVEGIELIILAISISADVVATQCVDWMQQRFTGLPFRFRSERPGRDVCPGEVPKLVKNNSIPGKATLECG